jgi:hypothetical protein
MFHGGPSSQRGAHGTCGPFAAVVVLLAFTKTTDAQVGATGERVPSRLPVYALHAAR